MVVAQAAIAVGSKGERALRPLDAHNGRVAGTRSFERIRAHHVIILLPDPTLRGDRRRREQRAEITGKVGTRWAKFNRAFLSNLRGRRERTLIYRPFLG